jgi:hypothetical protein
MHIINAYLDKSRTMSTRSLKIERIDKRNPFKNNKPLNQFTT